MRSAIRLLTFASAAIIFPISTLSTHAALNEGKILRDSAGRYNGFWTKLVARIPPIGSGQQTISPLRLWLRVPAGKGTARGKIDAGKLPWIPEEVLWSTLKSKIITVQIQRNGRRVKFRSQAHWLLDKATTLGSKSSGGLTMKIDKRGSKHKMSGKMIITEEDTQPVNFKGKIKATK